MGANGINLPSLLGLASATSSRFYVSKSSLDTSQASIQSTGPWTPPQYSKPAVTILTVPATGNPVLVQAPIVSSNGTVSAPVYQGGTPSVDYVFDAVLRLAHKGSIEKTSHPVLTGANISDHFYNKPSRVVLEIGMSDAMVSYTSGIWTGASTKSISAWQILTSLRRAGTLFTLTTRLDTYYNMMILDADAPDDNKTAHGLRATIVLEERLSAGVTSVIAVSARNQASGSTSNGIVQSTPINSSQQQQNVFPSTLFPDAPTYPTVQGAGNVSSTSLGQVP